ncbi:MAG: hypothetical protein ACK4UN_19595 [Limisphaerales bacterium]
MITAEINHNTAAPMAADDFSKMALLEEENKKLKDQVERLKAMLRRQLNYETDDDFEHLFERALYEDVTNVEVTNVSDDENKTCDSAEEALDPYAAAAAAVAEEQRLDDTDGSEELKDDASNSDESSSATGRARRSRCVSGLRLVPMFEYVSLFVNA